jgi:hypothetical protein
VTRPRQISTPRTVLCNDRQAKSARTEIRLESQFPKINLRLGLAGHAHQSTDRLWKLSGREGMKRPELEKANEALGPGDLLVLAKWDRASRSMLDGIRMVRSDDAARQGHFGLPVCPGRGRTSAHPCSCQWGRAAAKKRGVKFGPKPKLAAHQQREAVRMVREGQSLRALNSRHLGAEPYRARSRMGFGSRLDPLRTYLRFGVEIASLSRRASGCFDKVRKRIGIPKAAGNNQNAICGSSLQSGKCLPLST